MITEFLELQTQFQNCCPSFHWFTLSFSLLKPTINERKILGKHAQGHTHAQRPSNELAKETSNETVKNNDNFIQHFFLLLFLNFWNEN